MSTTNAAALADIAATARTEAAAKEARAVLADFCIEASPVALLPHVVDGGHCEITDCDSLADAEELSAMLRLCNYKAKVRRATAADIAAAKIARGFRAGVAADDDGASRYELASLTVHGIRKSKAFEAACAARGVRVERSRSGAFYYVRGLQAHGARAACKVMRAAGIDADVRYLD